MGNFARFLKPVVAAAMLSMGVFVSSAVGSEDLDALLNDLKTASEQDARKIEREIRLKWETSGSASADFLLRRGRAAMEREETEAAIEHLTALVDHAPEFAQGWVDRARAYSSIGLLGPALSDLEEALALTPQQFDAIAGLAALFEMVDRPQEAYETYLILRSIHPHHAALTEALERLAPLVGGQEL